MAEHPTVNRTVSGSSPLAGADRAPDPRSGALRVVAIGGPLSASVGGIGGPLSASVGGIGGPLRTALGHREQRGAVCGTEGPSRVARGRLRHRRAVESSAGPFVASVGRVAGLLDVLRETRPGCCWIVEGIGGPPRATRGRLWHRRAVESNAGSAALDGLALPWTAQRCFGWPTAALWKAYCRFSMSGEQALRPPGPRRRHHLARPGHPSRERSGASSRRYQCDQQKPSSWPAGRAAGANQGQEAAAVKSSAGRAAGANQGQEAAAVKSSAGRPAGANQGQEAAGAKSPAGRPVGGLGGRKRPLLRAPPADPGRANQGKAGGWCQEPRRPTRGMANQGEEVAAAKSPAGRPGGWRTRARRWPLLRAPPADPRGREGRASHFCESSPARAISSPLPPGHGSAGESTSGCQKPPPIW